jgi:hypothetical protein
METHIWSIIALMMEAVRAYQTTRRYNQVYQQQSLPTFQKSLLPPSSGRMMEAARTSETLVNFHQTTRSYNIEDRHLHEKGKNIVD